MRRHTPDNRAYDLFTFILHIENELTKRAYEQSVWYDDYFSCLEIPKGINASLSDILAKLKRYARGDKWFAEYRSHVAECQDELRQHWSQAIELDDFGVVEQWITGKPMRRRLKTKAGIVTVGGVKTRKEERQIRQMFDRHAETARILGELLRSRSPIDELTIPPSPGVYAVFLKADVSLHPEVPAGDLLYIGMSRNLAEREYEAHFNSRSTGFSSLRRSIGALLKERLSLRAVPRARGRTGSNFHNYRFDPEGEERLTQWMRDNLEVAVHPVQGALRETEAMLIAKLKPLLCLTGWRNHRASMIREARKRCVKEARAWANGE